MRKLTLTVLTIAFFLSLGWLPAQEKGKYPPPRFPSYVRPPKSIEDVMPFARAAVRQTGGRTPLGLVEKGMTVAIFTEPTAEDMVMQAIKRTYEERGVKVQIVPEHQLLGVSKEDALKAVKTSRWFTSEQGYMEVRAWLLQRFSDPEIPKKWLKEHRPDLYKLVFQREEEGVSQEFVELGRKFGGKSVGEAIVKYLDQHKEVNAIFWRRGGRTVTRKSIEPYGNKYYGNFIFDNRYELMNKAATFPGDIWRLAEERVIEPLSWVDRVEVKDPEGTDFSFEIDEKQAQSWAEGAYQQGHLFMFPHQATGRFPYSSVDYPAFTKKYNPRYLVKVNGVFAGTSNHTGSYPRIEVHVKDGYVKEVKGGGTYGELWREFLKYPKINELNYPYHDQPGCWWIYEAGMGTNPKFFKRPDENMEGHNQSERNNAGVIHWGFGLRLDHGPDKPVESKEWMDFAKQHALPNDHWWHIHNTLPTYRVRVRGTKHSWLTLIDKGEVTALKSPEIRALASRYGNPDEVLSDDWSPYLPGINAPGKYSDYAKDPWKTVASVMKRIEAGTYEYFYPVVKQKAEGSRAFQLCSLQTADCILVMRTIRFRLAKILGKRAFLAFGIVTLLVAGLLAAINLASHHALKLYIEDQLSRLAWDIALYQTSDFTISAEVSPQLRAINGITRVESLSFLRSKPPPEAILMVDGKPLASPWVSILSATDLALLPPEARPTAANAAGAFLALVGPEQHMGKAYLALQGSRLFSVRVYSHEKRQSSGLFDLPIRGVVRLERSDINRYFMDEIGSISFVPYIGVVLVVPHNFQLLQRFDALSRGALGDETDIHVTAGEYLPEVVHLARIDRKALISGWDIQGSLANLERLNAEVEQKSRALGPTIFVDNAILVLLKRMADISRLIGLATLLIAIPLLGIAWMLASNLSSLLILNERRTLGLMRLRGVPGKLLGQSLLLSIGLGGLFGGIIGLTLGTVIPIYVYEGGMLSWKMLSRVQGPLWMLLFLIVGLVLVLLISRRLVRYATTISPLEASRRVAVSESAQARVRFGIPEWAALILGAYKIAGWVFDWQLNTRLIASEDDSPGWIRFTHAVLTADRALDFVALPLFVYGLVALLVAQRRLISGLLSSVTYFVGGKLRSLSLKHMSLKPHRIASFLLIAGLMASVSLYPSIASKAFEDKALRGATVQVGSELHVTINPNDLVTAEQLEQGLGGQVQAIRAALKKRLAGFSRPDVASVDCIFEAILPGFFFPGYGLSGVPLYLIDEPDRYLKDAFFEEPLGVSANFSAVIARLKEQKIAASPPVAAFWNLGPDEPVLLGADLNKKPVLIPAGGVLGFLPGMPPRSISDRQSYVSARIDYLNYLSSTDAYLVASADNRLTANLKVLLPRVLLLVRAARGADADAIVKSLAQTLRARPLEVRELKRELKKVSGDMFIFLALENMRIYLIGGVLLALIAILSIALTNYLEDRRTLGLLRVRGVSPLMLFRFFASSLLAPALLGLVVGLLVAGAAGFGLTNLIWSLRELKSAVHLLPTHLVLSDLTVWISVGLLAIVIAIALLFSLWVFRRSARVSMGE